MPPKVARYKQLDPSVLKSPFWKTGCVKDESNQQPNVGKNQLREEIFDLQTSANVKPCPESKPQTPTQNTAVKHDPMLRVPLIRVTRCHLYQKMKQSHNRNTNDHHFPFSRIIVKAKPTCDHREPKYHASNTYQVGCEQSLVPPLRHWHVQVVTRGRSHTTQDANCPKRNYPSSL